MFGILRNSTNTGLDSELISTFAAPISIASNQPIFGSDTLNLRRITNSQNVQRWEIEAVIAPMDNAVDHIIHNVLNGHSETFYIRMPRIVRKDSDYLAAGLTLTISGNPSSFSDTIDISGFGESSAKLLGEFIRIGSGDPKVYLVTDAGSNGVGVKIFPPLLSSKSNGNAVVYGEKTTLIARYDMDTKLGIQYTDGILSSPGSIRLIEDI